MSKTGRFLRNWATRALALAVLPYAPLVAQAGFTSADVINNNTRRELADGHVYTVKKSVTIKAGGSLSALSVASGATAVLYIPEGITLTVKGGKGIRGADRAGAGIEVPSGATLIVTGGGKLVATGGDAGDGGDGDSGGDGYVNYDNWKGGSGGKGGWGGGGAGAGIGGMGGWGGDGGGGGWNSEGKTKYGGQDSGGSTGSGGNTGGAGAHAGTVYLLGSVEVVATGGAKGAGGNGGDRGSSDWDYWTYEYHAGWGGGGAGGGGGRAAPYGIGGGGAGGGGGGGGGSGGRFSCYRGGNPGSPDGGGGDGGYGGATGASGGGTRSCGDYMHDGPTYGGYGGNGGSSGTDGYSGNIYTNSAVRLNSTYYSASSVTTHSAIEYTLTFDDGWRMNETRTAHLGYAVPEAPVPTRYGYTFAGWYAASGGTGAKYFNADGSCALVSDVWGETADRTLYPKWNRKPSEDLDNVTLSVNGTAVVEGTDVSGAGWRYNSAEGKIHLTSAGTYVIGGKDVAGFAMVSVTADADIRVSGSLEMHPGSRGDYSPFNIKSGAKPVFTVETGATCTLEGAAGKSAMTVDTSSAVTIDAQGVLNATGGAGAADLGPGSGEFSSGTFYVVPHTHWASNIRPGNGTESTCGLFNDQGRSAPFKLSTGSQPQVWCVRISELNSGTTSGPRKFYIQRRETSYWDIVEPDDAGNAWIWLEIGGYEWACRESAKVEEDTVWNAYVNGAHMAANVFLPLKIVIDGEDAAHLTGPGWYCKRYSSEDGGVSQQATLVITNAGPHVVEGYGNAQIVVECDTALTVSNLVLNTASWTGKSPLEMSGGVTLDLTVEGTNTFTAAMSCAGIVADTGKTVKIRGNGQLKTTGGAGAAGIGGSPGNGAAKNGAITIEGGRIVARGGSNAAGIGSAKIAAACSEIRISGGHVTAVGGQYGAAIGGGYTAGAKVVIEGGSVFPTAGTKANAIGSGYYAMGPASTSSSCVFGVAGIFTKTNSVTPAAVDSNGSAVFPVEFEMGMPNCRVTLVSYDMVNANTSDLWTDETGNIVLWMTETGTEVRTVSITAVNGNGVETTKSWGVKIDGNGKSDVSNNVLTIDGVPVVGQKASSGAGWSYDPTMTALVISSGDHSIGGTSTNGQIRIVVTANDANLTIDGLTLMTSQKYLSPFVVSNRCTITLAGENTIACVSNPNARTVSAAGSEYTAAVEVPAGASLTVKGDGSLIAIAGICGAGIGSRGKNEKAGSITIEGGLIYAIGGWGKSGGGSGVGGGYGGGVESIIVNGGYLYAVGGRGACGIGGGAGKGPYLTNGTFRVTGGTVCAQKGEGDVFSDFVTATGNVVDPTLGKSIVIDGPASVRPANAIVANANPYPKPVNSAGEDLSFAVIGGLAPGETVHVADTLWKQYGDVDLTADEGGAICLWGVHTNVSRTIDFEGANFTGGSASLTINARTNTIYDISNGGEDVSERRIIDGQTCWLVTVSALPAGKRSAVTGMDPKFVRATVVADNSGKTRIYVPDGEYDFTVAGHPYHASVAGAATNATYSVGIRVDGVDVGAERGDGWSYSGTFETLTLESAREYTLSGTNTDRRVTVVVKAAGTKVRADRLVLAAASRGSFALEGTASLQFTGGTMTTDEVEPKFTVSGGTIDSELISPVDPSGNAVRRLTIGGFARYGLVEIESIEGFDGYDLSGIYANALGEVHLWVPDGDYFFNVIDGATTNTMIAAVQGEPTVALNYEATGVTINGREAGRLLGPGWVNEDGLVTLNAATNYVISGTNDGARISIRATKSLTEITLRDLVMTNSLESAAPLALAATSSARYTVDIEGTNILYGTGEWNCGLEMGEMANVVMQGSGRLEVQGADAPGIGLERGGVSSAARLTVSSGEIVATGGSGSAGIGGGGGQDGFRVEITGGIVRATGGSAGAGIGGGTHAYAGLYIQSAGTVVAKGTGGGADIGGGVNGGSGYSSRTIISGGSLNATRSNITVAPRNMGGQNVYRVTIPVGRPNFDVGAVMPDYNGYSLSGAVTDESGCLYTWLTNGTYYISMGGKPYRATVSGADVVAEEWYVGVAVDGNDLANLSGDGWSYALDSGVLSLESGGHVVSGTNTEGSVRIEIDRDISVAFSNLVLKTSGGASPVSVATNAAATVAIAGENSFTSGGDGYPGISVPHGATLSVTNIEYTVSLPDLDNISVYTNVLYDTEELDDGTIVTNGIYCEEVAVTNYYDAVVAGMLRAAGGSRAAGIGGGERQSHGTVEILGGGIAATGGTEAAGMGSGYFPDFGDGTGDAETLRQGTIRIRGGEVTAQGGGYGAGVGGGNQHSGGVIEISGGKVVANGGNTAAGIGGGFSAFGHTVSISGGEVVATGGTRGAGIGGATLSLAYPSNANTEPCQIAISGGRVVATGDSDAAGIGSGYRGSQCAAVNITGGTVVASGGAGSTYGYSKQDDIGIGSCASSDVPTVYPLTIKSASVRATHRTASAEYVSPAPSNGTERVWCVTVDTGMTNQSVRVENISGYTFGSDIYSDADGRIYLWLPDGKHNFTVGAKMYEATVDGADATAARWLLGVTADGVDVSEGEASDKSWGYIYSTKTLTVLGDCTISGTNTQGLVNIVAEHMDKDGSGDPLAFTISNLYLKTRYASPLKATDGTVSLRLAGVNMLDASNTGDYAGLNVDSTATLAITNLEENAVLTAKGGTDGAGIGGNRGEGTGTIRIEGGLISAYGSDDGAGIGSGYKGTCGDIYISGGRVTAIGGTCTELFGSYCGAGIGGGDSSESAGCRIEISGGTVIARSPEQGAKYAAVIGDGYSSRTKNGYKVVICGGTVMPGGRSDSSMYFTPYDSRNNPTYPADASGERVFRVMLPGFTADAKADIEIDGYGTNDIYADYAGAVHLWLAPGVYKVSIGSVPYLLKTTATGGTLEELLPRGVTVDGVDVIAFSGDVWTYDVFDSKLSVTGACVIAGTNTEGKVNISVDSASGVTISNLCLKTTGVAPLGIASGTNTLFLAGTNTLDATGAAGRPGLHVGMYAGLVVTNLHDAAKLVAKGGAYAAGIGGDAAGIAGSVVIEGGVVEATGGEGGAGIGGGNGFGFVAIEIKDGTVMPAAGAGAKAIGYGSTTSTYIGSEKIVFTGGSICASAGGVGAQVDTKTANAAGESVYPAALPGFTPHAKVDFAIDGYGTGDIYADADGKIYPWLAKGDYIFMIGGVPHLAAVTESGAVAEPWLSGVTANGTDLAYTGDEDGMWRYDISGRTLYILSGTSPEDCVTVSGTNTSDYVHIVATNDLAFAIRDLKLVTTNAAPVFAKGGAVTVMISGTNVLDATSADYCAGLQVAKEPASLAITNLEANAALEAKGGMRGAGIGGGASVQGVCSIAVRGGAITAVGGGGGAGIGGGYQGWGGRVGIYAGSVKATGGSYATGIGGGNGGKGYVYISGGTVVPAGGGSETTKSVGNGNAALEGGEVRFTGGSIFTTDSLVFPAASNDTARVYRVDVPGITPGAAVAFDGLPEGYGTAGIHADADGKVYLWLPENWTEPVTPKLLMASHRLASRNAGTAHTFAANGYSYTIEVPSGGGAASAEKGEALKLETLKILEFAVEDGWLVIAIEAKPATWLQGFADALNVRAFSTLPIPADATLDLSGAVMRLEDGTRAVWAVPLGEKSDSMFFSIDAN